MNELRETIGNRDWLFNNFSIEELVGSKGTIGSENFSSEYTLLIQFAARYCEMYASDLLYDIKEVEEFITSVKELPIEFDQTFVKFLGFRDYGVDGESFIAARLSSAGNDGNLKSMLCRSIYRKLVAWVIEVDKEGNYTSKLCCID